MSSLLMGCITYSQKTEFNSDGSGEATILYTAKKKDILLGKIDGFAFTEKKVRASYESQNTNITSLKVIENVTDSTISVSITLSFKDFNKLSLAKGFSRCKPTWEIHKDTTFFSLILLPDSSVKEIPPNSGSFHLEFEFPNEIIQTNGKKDGKVVSWKFKIGDFSHQQKLTAIMLTRKSSCGIFGIELPVIIILYLSWQKKRCNRN